MQSRLIKTARPAANRNAGRNDWYRMSAKADGTVAEIHIYDEIGYWGVTASDFIRDLQGIDASQIDVHLNTPGGDVFDGIAIYNALQQHKANVTMYVDSLAASIGSVIAMAGNEVVMAKYSTMMIHEASGVAIGANAEEMRTMADLLDKTSANLASVYADKSGTPVEEWRALMQAETWFSADEAVEFGLADRVNSDNNTKVSNSWDLSIFNYPGRHAAPAPTTGPVPAPDNVLEPSPDAPEKVETPPGGGGEPEPAFVFSPDAFASALDTILHPPVEEEVENFELDPDVFRAMIKYRSDNAPAATQTPKAESPPSFESTFDPEFLRLRVMEGLKNAP